MARGRKSHKILFIADPPKNFDPVAETTLYLMRESQRRNHEIYWTSPARLSAMGTEVLGLVQKIRIQNKKGSQPWYKLHSPSRKKLTFFDAILLRKDPPFDIHYLHHLYLMEILSNQVYMMNHPSGILVANEKLLSLPFGHRTPKTLISADLGELMKFVQKNPKGTMIKPLNEAGGKGVFHIAGPKSKNIRVILETSTQGFSKHIVAQAYLPEGQKGDKRILLLGQEILGAFVRRPAPGEHRANLHAGGKAQATRLTPADRELVALVQPTLAKLCLDFVGLDIIGNSLIEVNNTSPMGIHEVNKVNRVKCEKAVLDFIEERVKEFR